MFNGLGDERSCPARLGGICIFIRRREVTVQSCETLIFVE